MLVKLKKLKAHCSVMVRDESNEKTLSRLALVFSEFEMLSIYCVQILAD